MQAEFRPPRSLRNAHLQSVLASSPLRRALVRRRRAEMVAAARSEVLECDGEVRLETWTSRHADPVGTALLLHGWEGCVDSTYLLDVAGELYQAGYTTVRLNFRDHGDTHHLNRELFHSCRLDEVVSAAAKIAAANPGPLVIAGFSLGGNFALRVALNLEVPVAHTVAVSPVISPAAGLQAIESAPAFYEAYFMRKWRRSLHRKRKLYPDDFDWDHELDRRRLRELTAWLVERYTDFGHVDAYLDGYSIARDRLAGLRTPATIVAAADDPVIPVADFHELMLPPQVELVVTDHGGHCGFIEDWRLSSWIARFIRRRFDAALGRPRADGQRSPPAGDAAGTLTVPPRARARSDMRD